MTTYVLNIDLDAPCPRCGKPGSVNGGLCFGCALIRANQKHIAETRRRLIPVGVDAALSPAADVDLPEPARRLMPIG